MDFSVEVRTLDEVRPHPGADRLDIGRIGGYQTILAKDRHHAGEQVLYVPEAALLPAELIAEMGLTGKLAGPDRNRVKAIRLRGVLSEGIAHRLYDGRVADPRPGGDARTPARALRRGGGRDGPGRGRGADARALAARSARVGERHRTLDEGPARGVQPPTHARVIRRSGRTVPCAVRGPRHARLGGGDVGAPARAADGPPRRAGASRAVGGKARRPSLDRAPGGQTHTRRPAAGRDRLSPSIPGDASGPPASVTQTPAFTQHTKRQHTRFATHSNCCARGRRSARVENEDTSTT